MSETIPEPVAGAQRTVLTPGGRLHVTDYPGASPPLVMLHGFPDDSRIYDRLAPLLPPRRAVALDWLGYGRSDPTRWPWSATTRQARTPSNSR